MPVQTRKLVKKQPSPYQLPADAAQRPFEERENCIACDYTSFKDGLLDFGVGSMSPEAVPICPFCAAFFTPKICLPEKVSIPSDIELVGAWREFTEDLINYHNHVSRLYHRAKVQCNEVLPEALEGWALGDWSVGYANAIAHDEEFPLFDSLWLMLMHERLLARTATAYGYVEALLDSNDAQGIQHAIAHPEVLPVWELYLSACSNRPPHGEMTQSEKWSMWAE